MMEVESKSLELLYLSARVESMLGNHEAGRKIYSRILELFGAGQSVLIEDVLIAAKTANLLLDPKGALGLLTRHIEKLISEANQVGVSYDQSNGSSSRLASFLVARGEVFLSLHELENAEQDFKRALEYCPQFLPTLAAYGSCLLEQSRYFETVNVANRLLALVKDGALNLPQNNWSLFVQVDCAESDLRALYLKSMVFLLENDLSAVKEIEREFPDSESSHPWYVSILAGRAYLSGDSALLAQTLKKSQTVVPGSSLPFLTVGRMALMSRQNVDAEKYLKLAIEVDIRSAGAYYLLGQLFLRTGRVEEAREYLFRARLCDPAFENSVNYLNVLDYMADSYVYSSFGESVIVKTHLKEYPLQLTLAPMIRQFGDQFGRKYRFAYNKPLVVEVHPDSEKFSLRAAGLPWVPVAGVCFGRVVALLSPSVSTQSINQRSLLAHELSHSYTVGKTKGRIPRWLTEGLAQIDSGRIRPEFYGSAFKLFSQLRQLSALTNLDRPFIRPRSHWEVGAAYYQAWLVTKWLIDNYGMEKMVSFLEKLGTGEVASAAIFQYFDEKRPIEKRLMNYLYSHGASLPLRPALADPSNKDIFDRTTVENSHFSINFDEEAVSLVRRKTILRKTLIDCEKAVNCGEVPDGEKGFLKSWKDLRFLLGTTPSADLYAIGGEILLALKKPERAEKYLIKATGEGDNTAETLLSLAKALVLNGKSEEAVKLLEEGLPGAYPLKSGYDFLIAIYQEAGRNNSSKVRDFVLDKIIVTKEAYCQRRNDEFQWALELYKYFSKKKKIDAKAQIYLEQAMLVDPFNKELECEQESVMGQATSDGSSNLLFWEQSLLSSEERQIKFKSTSGREKLSLALFSVLDGDLYSIPWLLKEFERFKNEGLTSESHFIVFAFETVALKSLADDAGLLNRWWETEVQRKSESYVISRLEEVGYSLEELSDVERAGVLILALDSDDWFVRYRAGRLLDREAETMKFRNALWQPIGSKKGYNYNKASLNAGDHDQIVHANRELVDDVSYFWKNWLKNKL
jgi:tetratricopeptide (TPR) repeat protein